MRKSVCRGAEFDVGWRRPMNFHHVSPEVRPLFEKHGLLDFAELMGGEVGVLLSAEKGGREVRRLELDGRTFYLKRRGAESPMLSMLLFGHRPRSGPMREALMLDRLSDAGFLSMVPVAWGERRRWGLPKGGFLVVRGIEGEDVAKFFDRSSGAVRLAVMKEMGHLVGRLHAAGFFHPVRLKDLIRSEEGMTLIDRETSKPWPKHWFTLTSCLRSLARSARRTLRDGHRIGAGSAGTFLRGYHQGLGAKAGNVKLRALASRVMKQVRAELGKAKR